MGNTRWTNRVQRFLVILFFAFACIGLLNESALAQSDRAKTIRGEIFQSISDNFATHQSQVEFQIQDEATGRMIKLEFQKGRVPDWVEPGKKATIRGRTGSDGSINVEAIEEDQSSTSSDDDGKALIATGGVNERETAVILINLTDGNAFLSASQATSMMWGSSNSVDDLYRQSTFGHYNFGSPDTDGDGKADVFGPVNVNLSGTDNCDFQNWGYEADKLAEKEGMDRSLYDHVLYVLPSNVGCGWYGVAYMPGSRAYMRKGGAWVAAHELGHNLGMHHASTDPEDDNRVNSEYGDHSCPMGNSSNLHFFNSAHALQLGVHSNYQGRVLDSPSNGTYDLFALELDPSSVSGPQVLRIPKSSISADYHLSFRQPISYDSTLSSTYTQGINIHVFSGSGRSKFVTSLAPGESYTLDDGTVISADYIASDGSFIRVGVNNDTATCTPSAPSISLSPSQNTVESSGTLQLQLSLTNNDGSACPATTFNLSSILPTGISGDLSSSTVSLSPGATANETLTLNYSGLSGDNTVTVNASDSDGQDPTHKDASASAVLSVESTDTTPPTASLTSPTEGATLSGSVSVQASASDDVGVAKVNFYVDGQLWVSDSSSPFEAALDTTQMTDGSHSLAVEAVDAAGNTSAQDQISVTVDNSASDPEPPADLSLSGIDPAVVQAGGSLNATITGTGLAKGAVVTFEGGAGPAPSASVTSVSSDGTSLSVTISAKSGGPPHKNKRYWDVVVQLPNGQTARLSGALFVNP